MAFEGACSSSRVELWEKASWDASGDQSLELCLQHLHAHMLSKEPDTLDSSSDSPLLPSPKPLVKKWSTHSPLPPGPLSFLPVISYYSLAGTLGCGCTTVPNMLPHVSFLLPYGTLLFHNLPSSPTLTPFPLYVNTDQSTPSTFLPSPASMHCFSFTSYLVSCQHLIILMGTDNCFLRTLRHMPSNSGTDLPPVKENPTELTKLQIHLLSDPAIPLLGILQLYPNPSEMACGQGYSSFTICKS